jgi:hypothetical protein
MVLHGIENMQGFFLYIKQNLNVGGMYPQEK